MLNVPTRKIVCLLSAATLTAAAVSTPTAFALGLGKPDVESFIGQPLRLRIPVTVASEAELAALQVRIAGADWYRQAGIEREPVVDSLLVSIERSADGADVLITSANGVNQVVLPLLLEVSGPRMTLRKQVSVLLSPELPAEPADTWQDPRVEVSGVIGAGGPLVPIGDAAVSRGGDGSLTALPLPAPTAAAGTTDLLPEATDAGTDWPASVMVRAGDSLSTIVNNLLPPGATRFQGRIAFYERNPAAFENGDIHLLRADAELVVPTPGEILAIPRGEALARYQALMPPAPEPAVDPDLDPAAPAGATGPMVAGQEIPAESAEAPPGVETTASGAETQTGTGTAGGTPGYRLSLHDAPLELLPAPAQSAGTSGDPANPLNDRADDDTLAGDPTLTLMESGQSPRMQGFSLRMDALNAYIIELQDENRFLKQRVATLEGSIDQLTSELARLDTRLLTFQTRIGDPPVATEAPAGEDAASAEAEPVALSSTPGSVGLDQELWLGGDENGEAATTMPAVQPSPEQSSIMAADVAGLGADETPGGDTVVSGADLADASSANEVSRVVVGEDLLSVGRRYLDIASQPVVRLIGGMIVLVLLFMAWMMRSSRRERELVGERREQNFETLDHDQSRGVTFSADPEGSIDPDDADVGMVQPTLAPDGESLLESDVDLITQAEVYLKYHRPGQAVQALREEYGKPDSEKFVVAMRLVDIFRQMGDTDERNKALGSFISRVNEDIEEFSEDQWSELRQGLDSMRRDEQDSALSMERKPGETADVLEPDIEAWERLGKL